MDANQRGVVEGMVVHSTDGARIGKVIRCSAGSFEIEKGIFFPKDYLVSYSDITQVSGNDIYINLSKKDLKQTFAGDAGISTGTPAPAAGAGLSSTEAGRAGSSASTTASGMREEIRVPVVEEQLEVNKRMTETGAVRIHKEVITEMKQVTVPVTREEVRVERVPVEAGRDAKAGDASFQSGTVTVPIRQEEVEIRKRPVVKEEVRVTKESRQGEQKLSETLRKEKVDVDRDDDKQLPRSSKLGDSGLNAGGVPRGDEPLNDVPLNDDDDYNT
jgi:uncharacterized protein (TIGR02271 family)